MPKARIVVVEDEPAIRRGVSDALRVSGYEVAEAADGAEGQRIACLPDMDLVLLDWLLPKRDGMEVLAEIRKLYPRRPVIILTARGTEDDRVRGLKTGADDYVVKPFSARELLARVEAILRRTQAKPDSETLLLKWGRASIDLGRREVRWPRAERVELSETETSLLKYLVTHKERAVPRDELLSRVWGIEAAGLETRTVDMHVARLRAKLRDPKGDVDDEAILTVRAQGYLAHADLAVTAEVAV